MERQSDLPKVTQRGGGGPGSGLAQPWPRFPHQGSTTLPPCIADAAPWFSSGERETQSADFPLGSHIKKCPCNELSLGESASREALLWVPSFRGRGGGARAAAAQAPGAAPEKAGCRRSPPLPPPTGAQPCAGTKRGETRSFTLPYSCCEPGVTQDIASPSRWSPCPSIRETEAPQSQPARQEHPVLLGRGDSPGSNGPLTDLVLQCA